MLVEVVGEDVSEKLVKRPVGVLVEMVVDVEVA